LKSRIAIVGPTPTMRTGVANYISEVITASDFKDLEISIDFIVSQKDVSDNEIEFNFFSENQLKDVGYFTTNYEDYDAVIYNIGNSPFHETAISLLTFYPGLVVLHDIYLESLFKWKDSTHGLDFEKRLMEVSGISKDFKIFHKSANYLDLLIGILSKATKIIVHSEYAKELICQNLKNFSLDKIIVLKLFKGTSLYSNYIHPMEEGSFNITSFGFIDDSKYSFEIVKTISNLLEKFPCLNLTFVGQNEGSSYGKMMNQYIQDQKLSDRVQITGFVSQEYYEKWLKISHVAIQLRKFSRGESSYAVLDCMASGLPVITNTVGPLSELPENCKFTVNTDDIEASLHKILAEIVGGKIDLNVVKKNAIDFIESEHNFERTAKIMFRTALDSHPTRNEREQYKEAFFGEIDFLNNIENINDLISYTYFRIQSNIPLNEGLLKPRILIDVSGMDFSVQKTGIERLSLYFIEQLIDSEEFTIIPFQRTRTKDLFLSAYGKFFHNKFKTLEHKVNFENNDIVMIPHANQAMLDSKEVYGYLKSKGVNFVFFVYDILPISNPKYFPKFVQEFYVDYLDFIQSTADLIVTDSLTTLNEIAEFGSVRKEIMTVHRYYPNELSHHPSLLKRLKIKSKLAWLARPFVLLVGTVEPRKGYSELLNEIGHMSSDLSFIVVGKEGWKNVDKSERAEVVEIIKGLNSYSNVIWFANADDETLSHLYSISDVYLSTSHAEGLGLPLLEAKNFDLPVYARKNEINTEILGDSNNLYTDLANVLSQIKTDYNNQKFLITNKSEPYFSQTKEQNIKDIISQIKKLVK
jgi:glycosyltransferase involved in cell wall biosynthesis